MWVTHISPHSSPLDEQSMTPSPSITSRPCSSLTANGIWDTHSSPVIGNGIRLSISPDVGSELSGPKPGDSGVGVGVIEGRACSALQADKASAAKVRAITCCSDFWQFISCSSLFCFRLLDIAVLRISFAKHPVRALVLSGDEGPRSSSASSLHLRFACTEWIPSATRWESRYSVQAEQSCRMGTGVRPFFYFDYCVYAVRISHQLSLLPYQLFARSLIFRQEATKPTTPFPEV